MLPTSIRVLKVGLTNSEIATDWTTSVTDTMDGLVTQAIAQMASGDVVELPALTADERARLDEFTAVTRLVTLQVAGRGSGIMTRKMKERMDRTLGPELMFLQQSTGVDHAVGMVGFQAEQGKGVVAYNAFLGAAMLAFPGLLLTPTVSSSFVAMYLVDLRTGELCWINHESGYEVAGINFTDLREPESAAKMVAKLVQTYPKSGCPKLDMAQSGASLALAKQPVSPREYGFAINPPADWHVRTGDRHVQASRDGDLLNQIKVELLAHWWAFRKSDESSTSASTPAELAAKYSKELEALGLVDLEIHETRLDAMLADQPAFRTRFSFRLPHGFDRVRYEQVSVGTATEEGMLLAVLRAPHLHYFEKSLPDFEASVRTVTLQALKDR